LADYTLLVREAALSGIQGGTIYDALVHKCASGTGAEKSFTLHMEGIAKMRADNTQERPLYIPQ
jgi:hypothetical protein